MKKCKLTIVAALILFITACSKDRLAKATQTGANTFSCKVDGTVFIPSKDKPTFSGQSGTLLVSNSSFDGFILRARKLGSPNQNVLILLPFLTKTGIHTLTTYGYGEYEVDYARAPTYRTNNTYTGTINITRCDTINRIYSGTFSFKGVDVNTGKVVNVTDGRFDVKRQ